MYKVKEDLVGKKFGMLTVIAESPIRTKGNHATWTCLCDCGRMRTTTGTILKICKRPSCGCAPNLSFRHGMGQTKIYRVWSGMWQRCTNPNHMFYSYYGGKGISVCAEWGLFDNFYADMGDTYAEDLSIDRINGDLNYYKDNCRWATKKEQGSNKSNNVMVPTPLGLMTMKQASDRFYMNYGTVKSRHKNGWPVEKLLKGSIVDFL